MDHVLKKQAIQFRSDYGLKKYSPINCYELLEKLNVVTVFLSGGSLSKISGMALKTDNHRFMMVNSDMPLGRQHFTICHELYHLFVQEDFVSETSSLSSFDKKDKIEYAADLFAMYLMMPEDTIYSKIPEEEFEQSNVSLETILSIERDLQCSHLALIYRLLNLGIIKKERFEELRNIKPNEEAIKLAFDSALYLPGNVNKVIGNYQELAQKAFDAEEISESHYVSLLQDIFIES